jgi:membrane-associated PAP2 superfamily phosphatase/protein-S-isoprenylcysteine O-methyltransferase Ste14
MTVFSFARVVAPRLLPALLLLLIVVGLNDPTFQRTIAIDHAWEAGCICIAALGLALRLLVAGREPVLDRYVTGPHSIVRHPVLIGNGLVWLGLALFPRSWPTALGCFSVVALACGPLVARHDLALRQRLGHSFDTYAEGTPALVPAIRRWMPPSTAFSWPTALSQEGWPILGTALAFTLLEVAGDLIIGEALHVDTAWVMLVGLASLPWIASKLAPFAPARALSSESANAPWWESQRALLLACVVLLTWDASGTDMALAHLAGGANGFPWRESWLATAVLHDGLRMLSWACTGWVLLSLVWPIGILRSITRSERLWLLSVLVLSTLLVSGMKRWSLTSCPWDLAEFGGIAVHVSHWHWGIADGGPGHCFPGGHASGGFAFVAGAFVLHRSRPAAARAWMTGAILLGLAMGLGQQWRGAHFMSHTLWSAWLCWACAQLSSVAFLRHRLRAQ